VARRGAGRELDGRRTLPPRLDSHRRQSGYAFRRLRAPTSAGFSVGNSVGAMPCCGVDAFAETAAFTLARTGDEALA
jgi:hypothetical protein